MDGRVDVREGGCEDIQTSFEKHHLSRVCV